MTKMLGIAAILVVLSGSATHAATSEDCKSLWQEANHTNDDALNGAEAKPFADALKASGKEVQEDDAGSGPVIKEAEFMQACQADVFKGVEPAPAQ